MSKLFERSFLEGLHKPSFRPTADDWEVALTKTLDLLVPCSNKQCSEKWFVYDNSLRPTCPFCKVKSVHKLLILNFYSERAPQKYVSDNHRLVAHDESEFYQWHKNRFVQPNEKVSSEQCTPLASVSLSGDDFYLENRGIPALRVVDANQDIPIGTKVKLTNGIKLLTGFDAGDRVIHVQLVADTV